MMRPLDCMYGGLAKGSRCVRCGIPLGRDYETPPRRNCKGPPTHRDKTKSTDCIHRGDTLRTTQCKTCRGNVRVKVFACAIHTECTLAKAAGVAVCVKCSDYESKEYKP